VSALPSPVVDVSFGAGQAASTVAVLESGRVWVWGSNYKQRLGGSADEANVMHPRELLVHAAAGSRIVQVACGAKHTLLLSDSGDVFSVSGGTTSKIQGLPRRITYIDCDCNTSAAVTEANELFMWVEGTCPPHLPSLTSTPTHINATANVATVSVGSMYCSLVTVEGELYTWGYGGHGNLGHGNKKSHRSPKKVEFFDTVSSKVVWSSCTRGQDGVKGGLNPKTTGNEGPHTIVLTEDGSMYTFGTAHKGLLLNLSHKTGAFGENLDELLPYRVGGKIRNRKRGGHVNYAVACGPFKFAVSAHIHGCAIGKGRRGYSWGCGSNDGRCGVTKFLTGCNGGIDKMKCYLMAPTLVGIDDDRKRAWRENDGLKGKTVTRIASGRNTVGWICSDSVEEDDKTEDKDEDEDEDEDGDEDEDEEVGDEGHEVRLLFLDIDGVLHGLNERHYPKDSSMDDVLARVEEEEKHAEEESYISPILKGEFDQGCVERVKLICDATGCRVVLSSTWRLQECTFKAAVRELRRYGVEVEGKTECLGMGKERSREIRAFAAVASAGSPKAVTKFVAVDDDDLEAQEDGLREGREFVRTDLREGISDEDASRVVELFTDE
jgi:hypothetical protein